MKRFILLSCIILLLISLTSCKSDSVEKTEDWLPKCKKGEILLFNRNEDKVVSYDLQNKNVTSVNNEANFYQFFFNRDSKVFTSGHSLKNKFKVLNIKDNLIEELHVLSDYDAIFPLATIDDIFIFIRTYYDDNGNEFIDKRELCRMDFNSINKSLDVYNNIKGFMVSYGICIEDRLLFTTYIPEEDSFSLYEINYKDLNSTPILIETDLDSREIYSYNEKLILSDSTKIYIEDKAYLKESLNYIYKNSLIQIGPDGNGVLVLKATDIKNGEIYFSVPYIIDFHYIENGIKIFGDGFIEEIDIR